jgi:hypothetical protein
MKLKVEILVFVMLLASSCLSSTYDKCAEIKGEKLLFQDSISSGLESDRGIYKVSIQLRGMVENDVQFNGLNLPAGKIDTVMDHVDQYAPYFYYDLENGSGGEVDLEVCVIFYYSH